MSDMGEGINIPEPPEEVKEDEKSVKIRFSVFFDGTLNNRTNIDSRLVTASDENLTEEERRTAQDLKTDMSPEELKKARGIYKKNQGVGSFENGYTNVVKLERHIDTDAMSGADYDSALKTYVEGPGTRNEKSDKMFGYALGVGVSGVKKKVKQGLKDVTNEIRLNNPARDIAIELVTLDVFGFSRGAAAARSFIHEALIDSQAVATQLKNRGYKVSKVELRFAGLYDTVSSHGLSFTNDTAALNLDAVSHAQDVVHLAAADEHRENFSLTRINSAGSNGREIFLPGVHSDVGGSYRDGANEDHDIFWTMSPNGEAEAEEQRNELIAAGWYKADELTIKQHSHMRGGRHRVREVLLHAQKNSIANQYSRITLHIMSGFAKENKIAFKGKMERDEAIPGALSEAEQKIKSYVDKHKSKGSRSSRPQDWQDNMQDWLKKARYGYFHFSARLEIGNGPRIENGIRQRMYIDG